MTRCWRTFPDMMSSAITGIMPQDGTRLACNSHCWTCQAARVTVRSGVSDSKAFTTFSSTASGTSHPQPYCICHFVAASGEAWLLVATALSMASRHIVFFWNEAMGHHKLCAGQWRMMKTQKSKARAWADLKQLLLQISMEIWVDSNTCN